MSDRDDIIAFLDTCSEKVQRNTEIIETGHVVADSSNNGFLLHVSKDTNIKQFIPVIGHRQANQEDRTVPRVTVAPSLLGCLIGYASVHNDFLSLISDGSKDQMRYKGGWKIYALSFKCALKPNNRLVYDASNSDEHWLVAYNKETASMVPEVAGKAFYRSITYVAVSGKEVAADGSMYVEVMKENGIRFSKNIFLSKGYWVVNGPVFNGSSSWKNDSDFRVNQISRDEYRAVKNESAALLSHTESPNYLKW